MAAVCFLLLIATSPAPSGAATPAVHSTRSSAPSQPLPRSSPEAQGIASRDILDFVQAADEQIDMMNSFMLIRHGRVVAEAASSLKRGGRPTMPRLHIYSIR